MLRSLLKIFQGQQPRRVVFEVRDENIARHLSQWQGRHQAARETVEDFLRERFRWGVSSRPECPLYKLDNEGRVFEVHNNGASYGFGVAEGWRGIPGSQGWLVPESDEAKREIDRLPRIPQKNAVYELINWPVFSLHPENELLSKQEKEMVKWLDSMVSVDRTGTRITFPCPSNFSEFPRIQNLMYGWNPPEWLVNTEADAPEENPEPPPAPMNS